MIQLKIDSLGQIEGNKALRLVRGDYLTIELVWNLDHDAARRRPWEFIIFGANIPGVFDNHLLVKCDQWEDGINQYGEFVSRGLLELDSKGLKEAIGESLELNLDAELQFTNPWLKRQTTSQKFTLIIRNDVIKYHPNTPRSAGLVPIGTTSWWDGPVSTIPDGWLLRHGALLLIEDYPELFACLGITHGGDGITNFKLPNLISSTGRGRTVRAATSSNPVGSVQEDALQNINGAFGARGALAWGDGSGAFRSEFKSWVVHAAEGNMNEPVTCTEMVFDASRVARTSNETRMANIASHPIIFVGL